MSPCCSASCTAPSMPTGPTCAGCEESLEAAELRGPALHCPACGRRFDVTRAGRCVDEPDLNLDPVPLLVDDAGMVKVALAAPA